MGRKPKEASEVAVMEEVGNETPRIHPKWDETQKIIMAHRFHTIIVPEDENEPIYAVANVHGVKEVNGNKVAVDQPLMIRRGETPVANVPRENLMVLYGSITTNYRQKLDEKGRAVGGLLPMKKRRFPLIIVESYDTKR